MLLSGQSALLSVALWTIVALFLVGAGLLIARSVKRWTQAPMRSEDFTLQDLRELRASGQITPEEYEAMRGRLIARVTTASSPPAEEPPQPPPEPRAEDGGGSEPRPG